MAAVGRVASQGKGRPGGAVTAAEEGGERTSVTLRLLGREDCVVSADPGLLGQAVDPTERMEADNLALVESQTLLLTVLRWSLCCWEAWNWRGCWGELY